MGMTTDAIHGRVPQWTFADRLRKIRRDVAGNVKQSDFAERLGVGEKAYAAWESGANTPRGMQLIDVARQIETEYGVPASWVLGLDDGPSGPPPQRAPGNDSLRQLTDAKRARSRRGRVGPSTAGYLGLDHTQAA